MITLAPSTVDEIKPYFKDCQKKAKNYDQVPENAELLGIYRDKKFVGYFILVGYKEQRVLGIFQGYLVPEARHKNLSKLSMKLLEEMAKKAGYVKIMLATNRAVGSYIKFMSSMGYNISKAVFSKEVL